MSDGFLISAAVKGGGVRKLASDGVRTIRAGTKKGLRKAIVHIERTHKTSAKYMRAGGGAKNARQAEWPYIFTRTGTLKKSYTRKVASNGLSATYGSNLDYAKFLEEGTRRGIRARQHMPKLEKDESKAVQKMIADAIAKELRRGK